MRRFWTMLAHYQGQLWNASEFARSMRIALDDLKLDRLWIIYPGGHQYPVDEKLEVWPLQQIQDLAATLQ